MDSNLRLTESVRINASRAAVWSADRPEDEPENYSIITYQLSGDRYTTTISVTREGAKDEKGLEHSKQGWRSILGNLKKVAEEKFPA